jgi:hypothetical protein
LSVCDVVAELLEDDEGVYVLNRQLFKKALKTVLPTCVIAFGVVLAFIACTGNLTSMAHSSGDSEAQGLQGQRVFGVNSRLRQTVILRGNAGMMHVVTGAPGRVIIKYVVRHTGAGRPATIAYSQNSRANTVTAREIDYPRVGMGNDQVDFTVFVPVNTNLDFSTHAGALNADGVRGYFAFSTGAGSIATNNVLFEGNSTLVTRSGKIRLAGNVQIGSSCAANTTAGSVDAFFPRNARLAITASLALGRVTSDFSSVAASVRGASGFVGRGPYGRVQIKVQVGSIAIHRV